MPPVDEYDGYIRSVLTRHLVVSGASSLIEDVLDQKAGNYGIDALNLMDTPEVAELIRDEHPQIIATILIHLDRNQAAGFLKCSTSALRNDVILRIATFTGVQPAALQELTEVLGGMLDGQNLKRSKMGGVRTAAEILNLMNGSQEDTALENIRAYNEELASKIVDEMFLFENLIELDDRQRSGTSQANRYQLSGLSGPQRRRERVGRQVPAQYVAAGSTVGYAKKWKPVGQCACRKWKPNRKPFLPLRAA